MHQDASKAYDARKVLAGEHKVVCGPLSQERQKWIMQQGKDRDNGITINSPTREATREKCGMARISLKNVAMMAYHVVM